MDEIYFCPNCLAEHTEPLDAALGHVVRCLTCAIADDATNVPVRFEAVAVEHIRIETNIAA